jgi:hypothetical protein
MANQRPDAFDRDLAALEAELKRLEIEFTQFFAGRRPRPPLETRARVQSMVQRLDHAPLSNYGDRFRFSTLQSRVAKFIELWDRGLRAREEGRTGPFSLPHAGPDRREGDEEKS